METTELTCCELEVCLANERAESISLTIESTNHRVEKSKQVGKKKEMMGSDIYWADFVRLQSACTEKIAEMNFVNHYFNMAALEKPKKVILK